MVPYVIRENVPLAYFTFSYKKISTTHLALLTQCRWSEPQMKEVKVSKVMQVWVRSRRDDAIISRLLLSLSNYYTCQYMRTYFLTYTIFFSKSSYFVYISSFTLFFIFNTGRSTENPLKQDILKSDYDLTTKGIKTLLEKHERAWNASLKNLRLENGL